MVTISEDYVSFETAKLLKEKGFDEKVISFYPPGDIQRPTLQMAMKYLRKKHKLCIVSIPVVTDDDGDGGCLWNYVISRKLKLLHKSESLYESPETALNNAIKYCLENLI